jgi:nicotinate dehydrogenase subunit B
MSHQVFLSRRSILKGAGALVVSIGAPLAFETLAGIAAAFAQGARPPLTPDQLASYIAVNADGSVAAFFGKLDMGHGLTVAIAQIVAEELDVPFKSVKLFLADTGTSVNQGGASGSAGIQLGGKQMRVAAAEARRVLVEMAEERLGLPADHLTVTNGVVHAASDPTQRVSYADLIGGRYFNVPLDWNKQMGNPLYAPGKAQPKPVADYKIVGQPIKREDVAGKVFGTEDFCTDVKVPFMAHGRMVRPEVAGAVPLKVDAASIKNIPGARVVWRDGFLGVVADREWDAIQASRTLKVEWSKTAPPFPNQTALYDHIRSAPARKRQVEGKPAGDIDAAFSSAARVIEAEYEWPFQSHASMGPACALVEIKDGMVTCWSGTQKSHFVQAGLAAILGVPQDKVRVIWTTGPGSYGRNDADDCAMDAAVLAQSVGKPVRLQYMREQGTGWDPKGPASIHRAPAESYEFANKRTAWETIPPLLDRASPLRSSHLRDPVGPQIHFASESFMDEVAAALNQDPIAFRLAHIKDPRDVAVIKAAAEKFGWETRPSPRRDQTGTIVSGRGIAYCQRSETRVAVIAQVEIDRGSGRIWARRFTVAHDCGLIINPDGLEKCIEGNIVQVSAARCGKRSRSTITPSPVSIG